jgi:hypothetical protein
MPAIPGLSPRQGPIFADGRFLRCDLVWYQKRLIIEYDGSYWHSSKAYADALKADRLRAAGWTTVRARETPLRPLHREYDVSVPNFQVNGPLVCAEVIVDHLVNLKLIDTPRNDWKTKSRELLQNGDNEYFLWRKNPSRATPRFILQWCEP